VRGDEYGVGNDSMAPSRFPQVLLFVRRSQSRAGPELVVRFLSQIVLICSLLETAVAQCPVLLRQVSVDANRKDISIRYYNSTTRTIQAVGFTMIKRARGSDAPEVLAHFSTRMTLNVKRETTAAFHSPAGNSDLSGSALSERFEVRVTRVVFIDRSTWRPSGRDTCTFLLSMH
jgi:hypothetical protein